MARRILISVFAFHTVGDMRAPHVIHRNRGRPNHILIYDLRRAVLLLIDEIPCLIHGDKMTFPLYVNRRGSVSSCWNGQILFWRLIWNHAIFQNSLDD